MAISATHQGYASLDVAHRRAVQWKSLRAAELEDFFQGSGEHDLELNFQLGPGITISSACAEANSVRCVLQGKRKVTLVVRNEHGLHVERTASPISWVYGTTVPGWKLSISLRSHLPASVITTISWDD
jgi:hypothetical protein